MRARRAVERARGMVAAGGTIQRWDEVGLGGDTNVREYRLWMQIYLNRDRRVRGVVVVAKTLSVFKILWNAWHWLESVYMYFVIS